MKANSALLEELNSAISKLKTTGKIKEISRRWLAGPVVFITRDEKQAAFVGAALTLVIVAMLAIMLFYRIAKSNKDRNISEGRIRASLAEKEILLKEIHHRVKNNLQVISSMLMLQAGSETDSHVLEALDESQRRIRVMARIHENLHQSDDLASINAMEYVNTVVGDTMTSTGASSGRNGQDISSHVDVDEFIIEIDQAIACGQIISELLSNALKHAFPNGKSGKIDVSLHRRDAGRIELAVADDGIGLPSDFEFEKTQTLGMRLVQALAMQLSGVVEIDCSTGTRIQIIFPEKPI